MPDEFSAALSEEEAAQRSNRRTLIGIFIFILVVGIIPLLLALSGLLE